jgi:hypothetical protein
MTPALLIRTPAVPSSWRTWPAAAVMLSRSVTSASMAMDPLPSSPASVHVLLDTADQDRVRGLLGDEPGQVPLAGCPLRLDDLAGRVRGGSDVADLALAHEIGQRTEGLLDIRRRARAVHLIQVDVIRLQAPQRILGLLHDPLPGAATLIGPVVHRHEELRRQHDVVAAPPQGLAGDLLRHAAGIHVGGVDEVDPGIECAVNDADRVGAVVVAPRPEHHRAQAQRADRYSGPAQ